MIAIPSADAAVPSVAAAPRLEFLDGLRGLAALYVVLFHARLALLLNLGTLPHWASLALRPLNFGHYAVAVFIVRLFCCPCCWFLLLHTCGRGRGLR